VTGARRHFRAFLIAVQFLTRVPVPHLGELGEDEIGLSVAYYPLVGLLLGAALAALGYAASLTNHAPPMFIAALMLAMWVFMTGGLHLDGLADTADAWACGGNRERMLAVMKDPNCGPAGVSAIVLVLFLKFAALTALIGAEQWGAIALAPMLGRTAAPLLFATTPYVRPGGLGSTMAAHLLPEASWIAVGLAAVIALIFGSALPVIAALAVVILIRHAGLKKLGGTTGDLIGAGIMLTEMAVLASTVLTG
jgi:adenosylcobinamide-GDP ribazoletransferase